VLVVGRCGFIGLEDAFTRRSLALLLRRRKVDASLARQQFERLAELHVLPAHDERDYVAAGSARAETAPGAGVGKDHKTGCALVVERAKPLVDRARPLQLCIARNHFDDVDALLDLVGDAAGYLHAVLPALTEVLGTPSN
jgi:hypothetical protein